MVVIILISFKLIINIVITEMLLLLIELTMSTVVFSSQNLHLIYVYI